MTPSSRLSMPGNLLKGQKRERIWMSSFNESIPLNSCHGAKNSDVANWLRQTAKSCVLSAKQLKSEDEAQVRLEASPSLSKWHRRDGQLDIVAGERVGPTPLVAGVPTRIQGSPEVVAVIPGVARLRVSGPTGSTEEYRNEHTEGEKKSKLTASYGS